MHKTTFHVQKMDCASEEQFIRLKLQEISAISFLQFDIPGRRLDVYHTGDFRPISDALNGLRLDTTLVESGTIDRAPTGKAHSERKLLLQVLCVNFFFFFLEIWTGFISHSMGLVADSLDMLADALVYGLALFAVGAIPATKKKIAKASGYFQFLLAVLGLVEVIRRFLGYGPIPVYQTMMIISILAFIGNASSLYLLRKSESREAHMQASLIFTSNDVIINLGVIIAGALVFVTASRIPDLVIGAIIFFIVARGAYRILQIAK